VDPGKRCQSFPNSRLLRESLQSELTPDAILFVVDLQQIRSADGEKMLFVIEESELRIYLFLKTSRLLLGKHFTRS